MMTILRLLTVVLLGLVTTARADDNLPPWQRELKGDDAKKAATLEPQIEQLQAAGKFAEAVPLAEALRALRQQGQGANHWQTADAARQLRELKQAAALPKAQQQRLGEAIRQIAEAEDLFARGKYADAESLVRKALAICEEVLGPRHPRTAENYDDLAAYLSAQGKARDAEPLHRKALAIKEEVLGPKHPLTATSYNNLAYNLFGQGKARDAESLHRKALAIRQEVLGPRHPDTAYSYNNLGVTLDSQGKVRDAEPLHRKALAIREAVLGPRHADTAASYNNLAINLYAQGKVRDAEPLYRQALASFEEVLGPKHPHTAQSCDGLAVNLYAQGKVRDAELLFRKALAVREEVLGPRHFDTAYSYNNLAGILDAQGKARDAEPLYRKALAIREEVLGPKHPITALSYNNLAFNLGAQGKADDAEPLHRKALAIRVGVLGPKHGDTAQSYHNLAMNLSAQGKARDAEPLFRKALAIFEEVLGPKHPDTAISCNSLATNLDALGKSRDAEPYWRAAALAVEAARLQVTAAGLDRAAATRVAPSQGLALSLARQGRAAEAWGAAERGLARGLLDDLTAGLVPDRPDDLRRLADRAARLEQLNRDLLPLLTAEKLDNARTQQRQQLTAERDRLQQASASEAADVAQRNLTPLDVVQQQLPADAALVFWIDVWTPPGTADPGAFHYACVVRRQGPPVWVRLPGRGPNRAWTEEDEALPGRVRQALARRTAAEAPELARQLATQRLEPLAPHLAATSELPAVTRLIALPVGAMAGVPLEALSEGYAVSYAPSASVFARLAQNHRPLGDRTLLALGDPAFAVPADKRPEPPSHGLLALQVLPDGNAFKAGLRDRDVLLAYAGTDLRTTADLRVRAEGGPVPARVWRDGETRELTLGPGKLGVAFHKEPAPVALRQQQELETLLASTRGTPAAPLPGTRREVQALAALFAANQPTVLLGSEASEQRLDELAAAGKLRGVRVLHFATHGHIDPASAAHSALLLAADRLPDEAEQVKQNKKVYTGQLTVSAIASWKLDADLVTLSACETGLGQKSVGDGFLGFTHVLLKAGARSLVVSLWKVDDAATALLMTRFYENLLGQREGLKAPLGRAAALREAQTWLRALPRAQAEALAARLSGGELRGTVSAQKPAGPAEAARAEKGERPYAHPYYWSAFVLIGDPD
jgi:CHAT domain-containing protein/tetratricopeptide (TPR) repeat protein